MLEESKLPHNWRTFDVGVKGRTGDLSQRPCGYGNKRSRTSIEIHKRSRTSVEIDEQTTRSQEYAALKPSHARSTDVQRCLTR